eukprot:8701156-Prorocentrum_lima.AAC.1
MRGTWTAAQNGNAEASLRGQCGQDEHGRRGRGSSSRGQSISTHGQRTQHAMDPHAWHGASSEMGI